MASAFVPTAAVGRAVLATCNPAARMCVATAAGRRGRPASGGATLAAPRPATVRGPSRRLICLAATSNAGDGGGDSGGKGSADGPATSAAGVDGTAAGGGVDVSSSASSSPPIPAPNATEGEAEGALENLEGAFDASLLTGLEGALDRDWDRLEASFFSAVEGAEKAKEQEASEVKAVEIPRAPVPMPVRSFGRQGGGGDGADAAGGDAAADGAAGAAADGRPPGADAAVLPSVVAAEDAGATSAAVPPSSGVDAGEGHEAASTEAAPKAKPGRKKKAPTLLRPTGAAASAPAADGSNTPNADGGDELGFVAEKDMFLETAEDHRWYSLQVKPGTENSVRIALQNMCVAVPRLAKQLRHILVPAVTVQVLTKSGKRVTREERLFPGYMLVCMAMDRQSYQDVRSVTHVQGFMGDPNREKKKNDPMRPPDAISAEAIAEINAKLSASKLAVPPPPGGGVAAAMGYAPANPAADALAKAAAAGSPATVSDGGVGASDASADGAAAASAVPAANAGLQAGDTVRIETGAHAGEEGVITLVNPAVATVRVTLDIFGVKTPVDVSAADVVRAAAPLSPLEDDPEFGLGLADL